MKYIITLIICLLSVYQMDSQITYKPRVQILLNSDGDTVLQMTLLDAKIILNDLMEKQIADSLIFEYVAMDSAKNLSISLLKKDVDYLTTKVYNLNQIITNNGISITNKDTEIGLLNGEITKLKKEVRKQKFLKIIGYTGSVVLPIAVLLLLTL